jgi:hypothetical protein
VNLIWTRRVLALSIAVAALPGATVHTESDTRRPVAAGVTRAAYFQLPLRFESTTGQDQDAFVARGAGYAVSVSAAGASLLLKQASSPAPQRLTMTLAGGNRQARPVVRRALPGVSNYLIGDDPKRWVTSVRGYGAIEYRGVYRGVDAVYYGNQQQLEFDFVVAPGAAPGAIALAFDGATHVSVDRSGELVIDTSAGRVVQHRPEIYQNDRGVRRPVRGGYAIRHDGTVGFRLGAYDRRLPLVIDPILSYATYLGGANQERANGVAVDAAGNTIVTGVTYSPDFPALNAVQAQKHGAGDAFVTKLSPAGDAIVYSTFFGGTGNDAAVGVAVDDGGSAYVTGNTDSSDFPVATNIGPATRAAVFVAKLDPSGGLVYVTRLGGSGSDSVNGIAVDVSGRAHIAGMTFSADFPVVNPWQGSLGGNPAFRTHDGGGTWIGLRSSLKVSGVVAFAFDPTQAGTVYAGSLREGVFRTTDDGATWTRAAMPPQRISAVVARGTAVFAAGDGGLYRSRDHGETWTVVSPYQLVTAVAMTQEPAPAIYVGAGWPANVLRSTDGGDTWIDTGLAGPVQILAASGATVYAVTNGGVFTRTGAGGWVPANGSPGSGIIGQITALAVDPVNPQVAYVGTTNGLFKTTTGGVAWTKLFGFSFYVGAIAIVPSDPSTFLLVSSAGNLFIHNDGQSFSPSGLESQAQLLTVAIDPADATHIYAGNTVGPDAFVGTLSADGSRLDFSTFIGGSSTEGANSIAVDSNGNRYVTGDTFSVDFPTVQPIQPGFGGTWDSFVVKLSSAGVPVYSTYLGGSATDYSARIAVDAGGRAYVTGLTLSTNFPIHNARQPVHGGGFSDAFVTALNEDGSALVYSTFLGGSAMENDSTQSLGPAIAVTPSGEVSVTGTTQSTNFPVTADAWHRSHAGGVTDVFVSRFDASGTLRYSTFLGGRGADYGRAIAVDSTGAMMVAGYTDSTDWGTSGTPQPSYAGSEDAFVVKLSADATPPDTIAPTTTLAASGTPGIPGWYKSPVTITLSAVDNLQGRGVSFIEYSLNGGLFQRYSAPFTITASGTTRITARATDWAGNVESPAPFTTVGIDTTGPSVGFTVSGTLGLAGWYTSPVTVTVVAVETSAGTGVGSIEYRVGDAPYQSYTAPFTISAGGLTQISARATDLNGNVTISTRTVTIDTSAPRTTIATSGTPGLAGWYRSPVTIAFSSVDDAPGSGVSTVDFSINNGAFQRYTAPFAVAAEGTTRIAVRATDKAGNVETATAVTVMIDASAPVAAITSPEARDYLHSEAAVVSFTATDGVSGLQTVSATLDGVAVQNGQALALLSRCLGVHTLDVLASDAAGNTSHQSVSFRIVATIGSLIATVNVFTDQGKIDASRRTSLLAKLNAAKAALDRGDTAAASQRLRDFIDQCAAQRGKSVAADAAAVLIADARFVRAAL